MTKQHKTKKLKAKATRGKLYAIVDDGEMEGDSTFYCPNSHVEYHEGMTLADIRAAYCDKLQQEEKDNPFYSPEEFVEQAAEIQVAWIVDQKAFTALVNGWPDVGNDSATYAANRIMKTMAQALAIKTLEA